MSLFGQYIQEEMKDNDSIPNIESKEEPQVLTEDTIYQDYKNNLLIIVTPTDSYGDGYYKDPYFKLLDAVSYGKAENSIRIFINHKVYTYHNDGFGQLKWTMSLARQLNEDMCKQAPKDPNLTVFQYIMHTIAKHANIKIGSAEYNKLLSTDVPDFTKYHMK